MKREWKKQWPNSEIEFRLLNNDLSNSRSFTLSFIYDPLCKTGKDKEVTLYATIWKVSFCLTWRSFHTFFDPEDPQG